MNPSIHLLALPAPTGAASETDEASVSSAKISHVFRIRLRDDPMATESGDGAATLTGTVEAD